MKENFDQLVGNATTINLLKRSLQRNTFNQITIFSGPRGTGKSTSAGLVAKALTCQHPVHGLACNKCEACLSNQKALDSSGESPWIKIINLGKVNKTDDVNKLIEEVFDMASVSQRQVFLFEEVHALKSVKNGFTALLSEVDRISPNTYIVMCTTELHDVKEELRSRALKFEFKRLKHTESLALMDKLLREKGAALQREIQEMVISYCKGIPREIEKLVAFITENEVSIEEIRDFLQFISVSEIAQLFHTIRFQGLAAVMENLTVLSESTTPSQVLVAIKDFLIETVFYLEVGESERLTADDIAIIKTVFTKGAIGKVISVIEKLDKNLTEADLMLAILKINYIVQGRKESDLITDRKNVAAKERAEASRKEVPAPTSKGLHELTLSSLGGLKG